jgi:hypothetical protein
MRVQINHNETTSGFFRTTTKYEVVVRVEFSAEELAIIRQRNLADTIVLRRDPQAFQRKRFSPDELARLQDVIDLKISNLMKGPDSYICDTPLEAKNYEANLTDALKQLKSYIFANAEISDKSKSFEL